MAGGAAAGLAHARVQTQIADEFARIAEAADVADRGHKAGGHDHVDPGHGHQPADLDRGQRLASDQPLHLPTAHVRLVLDAEQRQTVAFTRSLDAVALLGRRGERVALATVDLRNAEDADRSTLLGGGWGHTRG